MKKISVCVPTYNRPEMTRQLIHSFLNQDYHNKELVISDDSSTDEIDKLVKTFNLTEIKYYKNRVNLGYSKNLLEAMRRAHGDFIILLGDDDILLSPHTLSRYINIFESHPNVSFIYSNHIQFSNNLDVEYLYSFFPTDKQFKSGEEAMKEIWTKSIYIPGIGIRNNFDLAKFYPKSNWLFPQLLFIGRIISNHDAFGINNFLIAGRAHDDQLGFYAIKGERIKGKEKHATIELFTIFRQLSKEFHFKFSDEFLSQDLISRYFTFMLKEKMIAGRKKLQDNYKHLWETSDLTKKSKKLRMSYIAAMAIPIPMIKLIRYAALKWVRLSNNDEFSNYELQLKKMVGNHE